MSQSCVRHPMLRATAACGQCGHLFCAECLVHAFGPNRPPMCRECALDAAGVRQRRSARPKVDRRTRRARRRQPAVTHNEPLVTSPVAITTEGTDTRSDEERWMAGEVDELPGGWRQVF